MLYLNRFEFWPHFNWDTLYCLKQMVNERQDIIGSNCLKRVSNKVTVAEKRTKDLLKEYMGKLMNEENEWDHRISAGVKEGSADCIRIDEVAAALNMMKKT